MNHFIAKDDGKYVLFSITFAVVPYVGTWIEMPVATINQLRLAVVPYVGTWIEIYAYRADQNTQTSFPTWERG